MPWKKMDSTATSPLGSIIHQLEVDWARESTRTLIDQIDFTSENINGHYSQADFYLEHCTFAAVLFLVSVINANRMIFGCHKHYMDCIRESTARGREVMLAHYSVLVKHIWISGSKPGLPSMRERRGLTEASAAEVKVLKWLRDSSIWCTRGGGDSCDCSD